MNSKIYSPLRYPGGKAKLIHAFKELIEDNKLESITYVEPFAGGANIALSLLIDGYVSNIVINDIDEAVYSFWYAVVNDTRRLINKINNCKVTVEEWYRQKKIIEKSNVSKLDLAFAFLFLNRTNFSGIINAGPIGGLNQQGKNRINARFNKNELIKRIELIASYNHRIKVQNCDALEVIDDIKNMEECLIYFDPPYYGQGQRLYTNFYKHDDHAILAQHISNLEKPWVLTYDNADEIKILYSDFIAHEFLINYSANMHTKGKEVVFFNNIPLSINNFLDYIK